MPGNRPTYGPGSFYDKVGEWQPPRSREDPRAIEEGVVELTGLIFFWLVVLIVVLLAQWAQVF